MYIAPPSTAGTGANEIEIAVTVTGGTKFALDGGGQQALTIVAGMTYKFDVSDSSNNSYTFAVSTTSDGTHGGGSAYTTGWTSSGTPGSADAYYKWDVPLSVSETMYYYGSTASMGGTFSKVGAASAGGATSSDIHELYDDITLVGFQFASQNSLVKYSLSNQIIDDYPTEGGSDIDTSASTDEIYSNGMFDGFVAGGSGTQRLSYTGSAQSFTVPAGVSIITVELWGAAGGSGGSYDTGGAGGYAKGDLSVTAGDVLYCIVGQGGYGVGATASSGGGGAIMYDTDDSSHSNILAAGGAGGGGAWINYGGTGGGSTGGIPGMYWTGSITGGSQSAAGDSASGHTTAASGINGASITGYAQSTTTRYGGGGSGTTDTTSFTSAGGGGGYYGGGCGGNYTGVQGGGAGGSSYVGTMANTTNTSGTGNGSGSNSGGSGSANYTSGIGKPVSGSGSAGNAEIYMAYSVAGAHNDMALVSNAQTASEAPTTADIVIMYKNSSGTATLNTDLKVWASRDDGTNWTQGTLSNTGTIGTEIFASAHDIDISGQPSGTDVRYKITTHNQGASMRTSLAGCSIGWAT
jgi:hypothetical protein